MVFDIEDEELFHAFHTAAIDDGLSVIFAGWLKALQLEQARCYGCKADLPDLGLERRVDDRQRTMIHHARVTKACGHGHGLIVAPIERARQALAIKNGVLHELCRNAPVGIDVREIKFAARLQQAVRGAKHSRLVGAEIDHAIGNDEVEAARREIEFIQTLKLALDEGRVRLRIAECFRMPGFVFACDGKLLRRHVDARDMAFRAHKAGQRIDIPPCPAAKVEHTQAFKLRRNGQSAAIIAR